MTETQLCLIESALKAERAERWHRSNALGYASPQLSAGSNPPAFELKPEFCVEYDPTLNHLRWPEHQHAMDVVARLRKQKWGNNKDAAETHCLPLVCQPPTAHPRFLPCRLLLHLPLLGAAIRRSLLFSLSRWATNSRRPHHGGALDRATSLEAPTVLCQVVLKL